MLFGIHSDIPVVSNMFRLVRVTGGCRYFEIPISSVNYDNRYSIFLRRKKNLAFWKI